MDFYKMSKEELIEYIKNLSENENGKYGLVWDKEKEPEQIVVDCDKYIPVLREVKDKNINNGGQENILIEGDNFHSLSVLNYTHKEKIDIIYIDPPYNTGKKDFIYNDKFIDLEDGYRHSKWLNFMEKRLKLARQLLKETGVIFVSIDDNEFAQLKLLCDKIFGENNYIAMLSIENNPKGRKNSNFVSISNEYCLIYAKDKNSTYFIENIPKSTTDLIQDENGNYVHSGGRRILVGEQSFNDPVINFDSDKHYTVYYRKSDNKIKFKKEQSVNDIDKKLIDEGFERFCSYNGKDFVLNTYSQNRLNELYKKNALDFKNNKIYEKNFSTTIRIKSMVTNRKYDAVVNNKVVKDYQIDVKTTSAGTELKNIFGVSATPFDNPKNVGLLKLLISLIDNKNAIILDFFAGSGTTAQAILDLNKEDGGNRSFILCTNNENGICEKVTYPRCAVVITGKRKDGSKYSEGRNAILRYYKTEFVKNIGTRDQLYYDLTEKCIPMLCVKGNTFDKVVSNNEYAIFTNHNKTKYTCVYFDIFGLKYNDFINTIKDIKEEKLLYIFTLGNYVDTSNLKDVSNYTIESIPYKIVELYKKVVKMSKED